MDDVLSVQKQRLTISLKEIQQELGVSRRVATSWAKKYLYYKRIGKQYIFSRKQFVEIIETHEDISFEINY